MRKRPYWRRRERRVADDPEILELLGGDPELLAVVDAIHATQRRARPISQVGVLGAFVCVAVVIGAVAVLHTQRASSLLSRARAAAGRGPVIRTVIEGQARRSVLVDLRTSSTRPVPVRIVAWTDQATGLLRADVYRAGSKIAALRFEGPAPRISGLDPAALAFLRGYRAALHSGAATVRNQQALSLSVAGTREIVRIGRHGQPIEVTAGRSQRWRIVEFNSLSSRTDLKVPSAQPPSVVGGEVRATEPAATNALVGWFGGAKPLPVEIAGVRLVRIEKQALVRRYRRTGTVESRGAELLFRKGRSFVIAQIASEPEPAYGFVQARFTSSLNPLPRRGTADIVVPLPSSKSWKGQTAGVGFYLTIQASSRALLIASLRALASR